VKNGKFICPCWMSIKLNIEGEEDGRE